MQLDKNAIDMLLALDDRQLKLMIDKMAERIGIDTERFGLKGKAADEIRRRISELTDADLAEAQRQINERGRST